MKRDYAALVSSDWNQCLAPSGPFDIIAHLYPHLKPDLVSIFSQYTGNDISLSQAMGSVERLLPEPISRSQMDAYLADHFAIYSGVVDFIHTCEKHNVLFMINTTAIIGYFQRAAAMGLIPSPTVLSAHPLVRYDPGSSEPEIVLPLLETSDKGRNTETIARRFGIPAAKIVVIGDSGGDGPHFQWGAGTGATLVGSMTKTSLSAYCHSHDIAVHHSFGHTYASDEKVYSPEEGQYDFRDLWPVVERLLP